MPLSVPDNAIFDGRIYTPLVVRAAELSCGYFALNLMDPDFPGWTAENSPSCSKNCMAFGLPSKTNSNCIFCAS
jgi:hypothetical protein